MKKSTHPISLAGSQLDEVRHVCAFFNSDEEEYRVLLPFIKEGFEQGDKAVHVVNPINIRTICNAWPRQESTHRPRSRTASSSFGPTRKRTFEMVVSIRIGCWKRSSNWPAAMPREASP